MLVLLLSPAGGDTGETPEAVVRYATDNDAWILAGGIFFVLAVALLAAFVAGLVSRLHGLATPLEQLLVGIGGTAFTLCVVVAFAIWQAPLVDLPDDHARALRQAEAFLTFDDVGWFLLGAAGIGAAVMAVTASRVALRARVVPSWICWLGIVLGVASLGTLAFFGIFAWMAWIAGASIVLLAGARR
jgi:hypothetical protein